MSLLTNKLQIIKKNEIILKSIKESILEEIEY